MFSSVTVFADENAPAFPSETSELTDLTDVEVPSDMGNIVINFIEEKGYNTYANVIFYNENGAFEDVYSFLVSDIQDYNARYTIPLGNYYVSALPNGSCGGGEEYAYVDKFYVQITDERETVFNVILGSKSFVEDKKYLLYDTDKNGNCNTIGEVEYEKDVVADEKAENILSEEEYERYKAESNLISSSIGIGNTNHDVSNTQDSTETKIPDDSPEDKKTSEEKNGGINMKIVITIILVVIGLGSYILMIARRKKDVEYDEKTLEEAKAYNENMVPQWMEEETEKEDDEKEE